MRVLELKVPPVALTIVCGVFMWALSTAGRVTSVSLPGAPVIAIALALGGGAIALAGVFAFRQHGTTVNPITPDASGTVVADGIYRYTRNPMYLGLVVILLGWACFLQDALALLALPVYVGYLTQFQIKPEERALLEKFGRDYAEYMNRVRRWL